MKTNLNFKILSVLFAFMIYVSNAEANEYGITDLKLNEIENRVKSMTPDQLNNRYAQLKLEQRKLEQEAEQNPSQNGPGSSSANRLAEIYAELSQIQKILVAIAGLGAISALTDEGYNDNVPPVITVNGSNPVTIELGADYSDAGATAADLSGAVTVTSSGTVDTSTVGTYHYIFSN